MSVEEVKKKLNEWQVTDAGLVGRIAFVIHQLELAKKKSLHNSEDLDDATYMLARYAQSVPPRKSPRILVEEIILLILAQIDAIGIPSIAMRRFGWLMYLLSQPLSLGGLGIIEIGEEELQRICDDVIEDLRKKGLIVVDSGSLYLTENGSDFVNDRLLPCFDSLHHKWLDEVTDRIDFWIVAALEYESQVESYVNARNKPRSNESLMPFLPEGDESLYSRLQPKVSRLVKEYRQTIQPYEPVRFRRPVGKGQPESAVRVEKDIDTIAMFSRKIGEGVTRLAFSKEETEAMFWAKDRFTEFGFECRFDPFMNLHVYDRRKGVHRILVGTHIDTVLNGGKYDGVVGLVSFIEALRLASEADRDFPLPVDFVIFRAEESTVFKVALLGSKVATGRLSANDLQNIRFDRDQELKENLAHYYPEYAMQGIRPITLYDVLSRHTDAFPRAVKRGCWFFDHSKQSYLCYVEVHIEQGFVLERERKDFGVVTTFRAPIREVVTITGKTNHSGTTPMGFAYRQDALCAAAECLLSIESIGNQEAGTGADVVVTVGEISVPGMGINKIPGECVFKIDLRSNDLQTRKRVYEKIHSVIADICEKRSVMFKIEQTENSEPVSLKDNLKAGEMQNRLARIIKKLGYSYVKIPSGAGHDGMSLASIGIPTCMLFIPCKEGISHSPREKAEPMDIVKSAKVLLEFFCDFSEPAISTRDSSLESFAQKIVREDS